MKTLLCIGFIIMFAVGMSYGLPSDMNTVASNNGTLTIVFGSAPEFAASANLNFSVETAPIPALSKEVPTGTAPSSQTTVVPEPATLGLVGLGLLGLFGLLRKRSR